MPVLVQHLLLRRSVNIWDGTCNITHRQLDRLATDWEHCSMSRLDELRLMAKVARMYYDQGIRQQEITERLNIHQSKISRMLKRAREAKIDRISVATPAGFFPELEDTLESRFQLKEAVVVDSDGDEERVVRDLCAAAAFYLEN